MTANYTKWQFVADHEKSCCALLQYTKRANYTKENDIHFISGTLPIKINVITKIQEIYYQSCWLLSGKYLYFRAI